MSKRVCILLSCLIGLISVSTAQAADFSGGYIEFNPGYAHSIESSNTHDIVSGLKSIQADGFGNLDRSESGFGMNINLGYQFNQFFAAELGATWFNNDKGTFTFTKDISELDIKKGDTYTLKVTNNWGFDIDARATLPIRLIGSSHSRAGVLGIFIKGGPGLMLETRKVSYNDESLRENTVAFAADYGGGIEYNITNDIAINTQFNAMTPISKRNEMAYNTRMLISGGIKFSF